MLDFFLTLGSAIEQIIKYVVLLAAQPQVTQSVQEPQW